MERDQPEKVQEPEEEWAGEVEVGAAEWEVLAWGWEATVFAPIVAIRCRTKEAYPV